MEQGKNHNHLAQQFRVYSTQEVELATIRGEELLTAFGMDRLIKEVGGHMQAPKLHVAGSLFVKRHYCSVPVAALYGMSHFNQGFDFSLSNLSFGFNEQRQWCTWLTNGNEIVTSSESRECWRESYMQSLFEETVNPVFQAVAKRTGVSLGTLWAHLSFVLYYWYDLWMKETSTEAERQRLIDDFHFLVTDAPDTWFEGVDGNPFAEEYAYFPHPQEEGRMIRLRKKCCFNYCLPQGQYCYTCPGLTEAQRLRRIAGA